MIASLKKSHRESQYQRVLPLLENENTKKLYDVHVLQAFKWITSIWNNNIEENIIFDCLEKTVLIVSEFINSTPIIHDEHINLMNIEGENDCVGFITESELLQIKFGINHYE